MLTFTQWYWWKQQYNIIEWTDDNIDGYSNIAGTGRFSIGIYIQILLKWQGLPTLWEWTFHQNIFLIIILPNLVSQAISQTATWGWFALYRSGRELENWLPTTCQTVWWPFLWDLCDSGAVLLIHQIIY